MKIYDLYGLVTGMSMQHWLIKLSKADDHRENHSKLQKFLKADAY